MQYVAITQPTCSWLLAHPGILHALFQVLTTEDLQSLRKAEFASGPLRLVGSEEGRVLAIWNREYLTGTGSELWGVFKLEGSHALKSELSISQPVFERTLYVINQRLQGLVLDSELIHRPWPNGSHSCLAGRGTEARKFSIAYFEGGPGYADLVSKGIFSVGPERDFDKLQLAISAELRNFAPAVRDANKLIDAQRRRPLLEAPALQSLRSAISPAEDVGTSNVTVSVGRESALQTKAYETIHWDFSRWTASGSLNEVQRRVLESDALAKHPLRLVGPAGSGKTLLMQLLAIKQLKLAEADQRTIKILYIVHNSAMAQSVIDRFRTLGAETYLTGQAQALEVSTLSEYGKIVIGLTDQSVIDKDAQKTKEFQLDIIKDSLKSTLDEDSGIVSDSILLTLAKENQELFDILASLIMAEISTAIKGRGLTEDRKRYENADAPLSRFHRILTVKERAFVFDVFKRYHHAVFEEYEILDSDDVAISLAGRLSTPVWKLRRRSEGYDLVFVDEVQLFNENERRIFPYLTKGVTPHVPIALALDEAQEPFGFSNAGLATLGIADAENESLPSNHRSTNEITRLAFFVIQRTTDLFGTDFPDFTRIGIEFNLETSPHPIVMRCSEDTPSFSKFIVRVVQKLRAKNVRQIAVICHAESYWVELEAEMKNSQLPLHVVTQRGERLTPDQPIVVLSRPSFIGGQEFDAVILVGLEQGVMPPRIADNPPLSAALEQQVLREVYLSVSRARSRVVVALNKRASPNSIIDEAITADLLRYGQIV